MLRSRAIPVSFRFYIGFATAALVGAIVAALGTNDGDPIIDRVIGPLTIGWKGGIGDHLAYGVLLGVAVAAGFVGIVLTAFREADASAVAQVVDLEAAPLTRAPLGANYWPIVSVCSWTAASSSSERRRSSSLLRVMRSSRASPVQTCSAELRGSAAPV